MSQSPIASTFFNEEMAAVYDERFARLAPFRDALHLSTRFVMAGLPREARILCVGAGTGAEVLSLGEAYPEWRFTLVEPSAPMLAVARRRCEEAGLNARCEFHDGFLDSLPAAPAFDAATSILVSQFVLDPTARRAFFQEIAHRLSPGGLLVSADLSGKEQDRESLFEIWMKLIEYNGASPEQLEGYVASRDRDFAISTASEVEEIITSGGFEPPIRFSQTLLIQAWMARRKNAK